MANLKSELQQEYERLKSLIEKYDEEYYNQDKSSLLDDVYDILKKRFVWLSEILKIEYKKIGQICSCPAIQHSFPMLSIESEVGTEILTRFINKYPNQIIIGQHKIDGLSMVAKYSQGNLIYCATRGDGYIGEDVTANGSQIVPTKINYNEDIIIFGETYLSKEKFQNIQDLFSNPRNAASGILRRNANSKYTHLLEFIAYDSQGLSLNDYSSTLLVIEQLGFKILPSCIINSLEEGISYYNNIQNERKNIKYDIDGIVFKINDYNIRTQVGSTARFPRWAIASKFKPSAKISIIKSIEFQVSRNGILTPVAHINPIDINGICIKKVSLHNYFFMKAQKINIEAEVVIARAGDVIPYISAVLNPVDFSDDFKVYCPSCNAICSSKKILNDTDQEIISQFYIKYKNTESIESEKFLYCNNSDYCSAQIIGKIVHYLKSIKVQNINISIIKQLYNQKLVCSILDLYKLSITQLLPLSGWGLVSANKFIQQLQKPIALENFISALGFDGIGAVAANKLANHFKTFDSIMHMNNNDTIKIFLDNKFEDMLKEIFLSQYIDTLTQRNLFFLQDLILSHKLPLQEINNFIYLRLKNIIDYKFNSLDLLKLYTEVNLEYKKTTETKYWGITGKFLLSYNEISLHLKQHNIILYYEDKTEFKNCFINALVIGEDSKLDKSSYKIPFIYAQDLKNKFRIDC